ncbi:MAG: homogentisate 1,2-dioxygenase [Myxococcota bacterium]
MTLPQRFLPGEPLRYQSGFRAAMASEAREGALPLAQNSPRNAPFGLHPEQLNASGFTALRAHNLRTWMYRIRPGVLQSEFAPYAGNPKFVGRFEEGVPTPELLRFAPRSMPTEPTDFVDGMVTFAGAGNPELRSGLAIHLYAANAHMERVFYDADGDLLIVPEQGGLRVRTELGLLEVLPGHVLVIPKGIKFAVALLEGTARGYVLESYGGPFELPERGPIGANGLADARHFEAPLAAFEDSKERVPIIAKFAGRLWQAEQQHSPFDVVAWHGNHVPYRYDLARYNTMGSVSFDHPDPSIFTVLTVPFDEVGNNLADFAVFKGRWDVAEHTFRPPYFHRNTATEFNGIVSMRGSSNGFEQGGYFYTPSLTAHGVAASSVRSHLERSDDSADRPLRIADDSLWVMFETILMLRVMPWALDAENRDRAFREIYNDMPVPFEG